MKRVPGMFFSLIKNKGRVAVFAMTAHIRFNRLSETPRQNKRVRHPLLFTLKGEPTVEFAVYGRSRAGRTKWISREKTPVNRL